MGVKAPPASAVKRVAVTARVDAIQTPETEVPGPERVAQRATKTAVAVRWVPPWREPSRWGFPQFRAEPPWFLKQPPPLGAQTLPRPQDPDKT